MQGVQGATGAVGSQGASGPAGSSGAEGATGAAGPAGGTGLQGVQGATGVVGPQGASGPAGSSGAEGATGAAGPAGGTGLQGVQGATGAAGPQGPSGPAGSPGATGPAGSTGPAGPTGSAGSSGLSQYGYVYNTSSQVVALEAAITFDSNGAMTAGITHATGATGITLVDAGTYEIRFSVSGTEPNQIGIFINGVSAAGTIYGSGAGTQQNVGQTILTVPAESVLTIVNHSSAAAVTLATPIGGTQASTNASVVIEELD